MILVFIKNEQLKKILEYYELTKSSIISVTTTINYKLNDKDVWTNTDTTCKFDIQMNDILYNILNNIDNKNTTREIFDIVRKKLNIDMKDDEMLKMFSPVYEKFQLYNLILLKS